MEKQHTSTVNVKTEDEKALADTSVECLEQTESFKEKQVLRTEEITAIGQAIEILSADTVQGTELSLAQKKATALIQTITDTDSAGIRRKVMEFLKSRRADPQHQPWFVGAENVCGPLRQGQEADWRHDHEAPRGSQPRRRARGILR
jgi:hypothetical protein